MALLGAGNDTFIWNPGDGSDTVEGQAGTDTLVFNGANINENIDISANGRRVRFSRDVGNVTMDLNGVETIQFAALGGADTITVNDLTGTDVTQVAIDLAATAGRPGRRPAGHRDRQRHRRRRRHQRRRQRRHRSSSAAAGAGDDRARRGRQRLADVNGLAGDDTIDASALEPARSTSRSTAATATTSSSAAQGNDLVNGGRGNDVALLGAGDDTFVWNPGDGSDTVEGQAGIDTLLFNGANINENIDISANGERVRCSPATSATSPWTSTASSTIKLNALGRRRHHHGQRPDRDRRDARSTSTWRPPGGTRRRPGGYDHHQRRPTATT